ncbi:uncharacterized protein LOC117066818 [Trachypithecus francoisi]|uniref:uncharacterized protein LOC117066818 n=1 Tax=Trachypithecus francoisi TaxID=54180 RepID=UPI00141AD6A7|nr:uncharacterized protein LOC117066818 [Trachypithecus francoisi]
MSSPRLGVHSPSEGVWLRPRSPKVMYIWWQRPSLLSGWSALPHAGSTCAPALRGSVPGICMGVTGHSRSSLLSQAPGSRCGSSGPALARAPPRAFVRHALPARASCPVASGQPVRGRAGAAAMSQWPQDSRSEGGGAAAMSRWPQDSRSEGGGAAAMSRWPQDSRSEGGGAAAMSGGLRTAGPREGVRQPCPGGLRTAGRGRGCGSHVPVASGQPVRGRGCGSHVPVASGQPVRGRGCGSHVPVAAAWLLMGAARPPCTCSAEDRAERCPWASGALSCFRSSHMWDFVSGFSQPVFFDSNSYALLPEPV